MTKKIKAPPVKYRKMGRPDKLTEAISAKMLSAIRAGNFIADAAQFAGITSATYYTWRKKGEARETEIMQASEIASLAGVEAKIRVDDVADKYYDFLCAVRKAEAEAKISDMTQIGLAAARDWRAAAWRLEHKFPQQFGKTALEVSGPNGGPVCMESISLAGLTDEELSALEKLILRQQGADSNSEDSLESAGADTE